MQLYLKIINRLSANLWFSIAWIGFYVATSFVVDDWLEPYIGRIQITFDYFFAAISYAIYWPMMRLKIKWQWKRHIFQLSLSVLAGLLCYWLGRKYFHISTPYDFSGYQSVFILFLMGPIIDELIFRFSIWWPTYKIVKNYWAVILITSVIYSFSHYHAIFHVPSSLYPFKYYQTGYTFILGLWWGYRYMKTNTFLSPVFLHITFNVGFYLGYRYIYL